MASQLPETNRLDGFPHAIPGKDIVAHNGLSSEEAAAATALGYKLVDVRFELGRRGAEFTMLGLRQGTVVLSPSQLRSALAEVAAYAKTDTGIDPGAGNAAVTVGSDVGDFFRGLGSTNASGQWKASAVPNSVRNGPADAVTKPPEVDTKPRRGRPAGSKDKQKRAKRGSSVGEQLGTDIEKAMEVLINEREQQ